MDKEQHIIHSWKINAANWIDIIENKGIESRKLATNKAIVDIVSNATPDSLLDIGCGEGWLAKELFDKGIEVTGIDIVPELIEKARQKTRGDFYVASFEDIYLNKILFSKLFDAIVINFALIGKESTEKLLASLPRHLSSNGKLFIQTLHPNTRKLIDDYTNGWKEGSWDGLGERFTQPYQWYFRTLEDWLLLLNRSGFGNIESMDVLHPHTSDYLSVIFSCSVM
jgi:2-polyprenyl-3-methyl-5-hydroxy-6-metoxy-1,4-benzoquinol methylase